MTDKKNVENGKNGATKAGSERWLIVLVVVVLLAVVGTVAWSVISRRTSSPAVVGTVAATTNELPASTTGGETSASSAPEASSSNTAPSSTPESESADTRSTSSAPVGITVGKTAPDFTLKDLDGNSVSLHQYRGHVVLLDFWASWCPPCRASMPTLDNFAAEYRDKGLVMIGVSLDRSASAASSFLNDNDYHRLIALWGSASASQGVARMYGVNAIPHTFVIDRDGIIRFTDHPMRLTESILDKLFQ